MVIHDVKAYILKLLHFIWAIQQDLVNASGLGSLKPEGTSVPAAVTIDVDCYVFET
jgi:hypothetical protein